KIKNTNKNIINSNNTKKAKILKNCNNNQNNLKKGFKNIKYKYSPQPLVYYNKKNHIKKHFLLFTK
ncbi:hypothetical protein ACVGWD_14885, partial [Enterobacter asburiae]